MSTRPPPLIRKLVAQGRYYFLSRPRRFGKSLLLSTLKSLFEGREELFRGLDIHKHWDWSVKHPVVRLSFGGRYATTEEVEGEAIEQLEGLEEKHDLAPALSASTGPQRLRNILRRLHRITGRQVVVLIDEYDKPVLDALEKPETARANRDCLQGLYGILKDADEHVRFVFVTGITMFSKTSFSSGLNNLDDISLDPSFSAICGYTDHDLDTVFAPEFPGLDRDEIRRWYNGYHWLGEDKLYSPSDLLLLFKKRKFQSYWFATGQPGFLYRLVKEKGISPMELETLVTDIDFVSNFELDNFSVAALLFQAGYLTIAKEERLGHQTSFRLGYPNFEVQSSFNKGLTEYMTGRGQQAGSAGEELIRLLAKNDFEAFREQVRAYPGRNSPSMA